jgi:hypothetical protein
VVINVALAIAVPATLHLNGSFPEAASRGLEDVLDQPAPNQFGHAVDIDKCLRPFDAR